jgi:hypothetical protein
MTQSGDDRDRANQRPLEEEIAVTRWLVHDDDAYFYDTHALHKPIAQVIRDDASWRELRARLLSPEVIARNPAPIVDFRREMLLVVGFGQMTDGYTVEIDRVTVSDQALNVYYHRGWARELAVTDSISAPVRIVRIHRDDSRPVEFFDTTGVT